MTRFCETACTILLHESIGISGHSPAGQADWQKLWALEKACEDLPFDTPERQKRSVYMSLKIMLALITAVIGYCIYRHAQ